MRTGPVPLPLAGVALCLLAGAAAVAGAPAALVAVTAVAAAALTLLGHAQADQAVRRERAGRVRLAGAVRNRRAQAALATEQADQRVRQAANFTTDLAALVSHELAQPLSSVASLSDLLATDWAQLDEDTRLDLARKVHKHATRLVGMVRDVLLLFTLQHGPVAARRTPVPVAEVAESVVAALAPTGDIRLWLDPALCALADRDHLEQVLRGLVGNALAYGAAPVELVAARYRDQIVITVTDHGPGIPETLRANLFDRTVLPGAAGTGAGRGRGLGLYVARHLVAANSGTITYEPVLPHGTRVAVALEAATPAVTR